VVLNETVWQGATSVWSARVHHVASLIPCVDFVPFFLVANRPILHSNKSVRTSSNDVHGNSRVACDELFVVSEELREGFLKERASETVVSTNFSKLQFRIQVRGKSVVDLNFDWATELVKIELVETCLVEVRVVKNFRNARRDLRDRGHTRDEVTVAYGTLVEVFKVDTIFAPQRPAICRVLARQVSADHRRTTVVCVQTSSLIVVAVVPIDNVLSFEIWVFEDAFILADVLCPFEEG